MKRSKPKESEFNYSETIKAPPRFRSALGLGVVINTITALEERPDHRAVQCLNFPYSFNSFIVELLEGKNITPIFDTIPPEGTFRIDEAYDSRSQKYFLRWIHHERIGVVV